MKNKVIFIAVILVIVALIALYITKNKNESEQANENVAALGDPLDVASPFVEAWFDAVVSTSTDPYQAGLATDTRLTESVHQYLAAKQAEGATMDPVLCQQNLPPRIGLKTVYATENKAQFMVVPRGLDIPVPERALVDLEGINGEWKITRLECISGESAPVGEFTFDKRGFLLKTAEASLDPNTWHLVFEENGIDGHTAPLFFNETSMCSHAGGAESVCDQSQFVNPSEATVKGDMTETGVNVKRVEFVN